MAQVENSLIARNGNKSNNYLSREILNQIAMINRKVNASLDCNDIQSWFPCLPEVGEWSVRTDARKHAIMKISSKPSTWWGWRKQHTEEHKLPSFFIPTNSSLSSPAVTAEMIEKLDFRDAIFKWQSQKQKRKQGAE